MNSSKIVVLIMVIAFASFGLAAVAQTPSTTTKLDASTLSVDPSLIGQITQARDGGGVTTSPSSIYPYYFPYYGNFYPVDQIMRILLNADNAQYKGLNIATVKGITTIKADEITATSASESLRAIDFKAIIDKNTGTVSLSASSLDFKDSQGSFSGKSVSFTYQYYYAVPMEAMSSDGTISPMPTK